MRWMNPFEPFMERELSTNSFEILPILLRHAALLAKMPFYHRDPFDRLIVAQTTAEKLRLVSRDTIFDAYGIIRLW